ncbi:MAG TPA: PAS domain S-box protein [Chryseosolibacter sp.]|nr:PAS domain S-box protein [Chryseosolibacter sp.]
MVAALQMAKIFRAVPAACMVLLPNVPNFTIAEVSDAFLTARSLKRNNLVGRRLFEAFPDAQQPEHSSNLTYSLLYVLEHKSPHKMAIERTHGSHGFFSEQFWLPENTPVLDADGSVSCIIYSIRDVTDRVLAERVEDARKQILLKTEQVARTFTWQWNTLTDRVRFSENIYDFLALPPHSVHFDVEFVQSIIHENDVQNLNLLCSYLRGKPRKFELQLKIKTSVGDIRTCRVTGEPDPNRSDIMSGHVVDITEKKDLEESVHEGEKLFRSAFEYSPIGMALVRADRSYFRVNKSFCALLGYSEPELLEMNVRAITHPDDAPDDDKSFEALRAGEMKNCFREKRYVHKTGETIWASVSISAVTDANEEFSYYVVQIEDITQRKKIELALKRSEQEYRSLFEQNPDSVFLLNTEGMIISTNESGSRLRCNEAMVSTISFFSEFCSPEDLGKVAEFLAAARDGRSTNFDLWITTAAGKRLLLNITTMPVIIDERIEGLYCIAKDISEKNRLQKIINAERERFANLFASAPVSMAILKGPAHVFEKANANYYGLSGRSSTIIGRTVREVFPEAAGQGIFEIMDEVYKTGVPYADTSRHVRINIDGKPEDIYLNFLFQPFRNTEGEPEGIFFFGVNITNLVAATRKAEEREKQYHNLIEQMPAAVFTTDNHGNLLVYNKAAVDLWGKEPVPGISWSSSWQMYSLDGSLLKEKFSPVSAVLNARRPVEYPELIVIRPDRQLRYIQPFPTPLFDVDGNLSGVVVVISDITHRKNAEDELKKLSVIAKKTTDAIIMTDPHGNIEWVNQAFTRQTEFSFPEVIGKKISEFLHGPGTDQETKARIAERMRKGEAFEFEIQKYSKSGRLYWVEIKGQPLFDDDGNLTHFFEIETDITERKMAYEELTKKENEIRTFAKQLNTVLEEERSRIAREIHDEFGQQLTGLKMSLSVLQRMDPSETVYRETVQDMMAGIDTTIQSLKTFATELRPGILDTLGMIPSIEWLIREFEKKTHIPCIVRIKVTRKSFDKTISTTYFRICQEALTNIARHAGATRVVVEVIEADNCLSLIVTDDGRGIASEKMDHAYSMGLLGMRERARLIDADLSIRSQEHVGTSVEITVKLNEEQKDSNR